MKYGSDKAIEMLKNSCMGECFGIENAFFEPEIVFCADFSSQRQSTLPDKSSKLVNLIKLNMFNNNVTTIGSDIGKLNQLIYLDISSNNLTALPPEVW